MSAPKAIEIKEGTEITFDTLTWREGWEFDHPSILLRPFVKYYEDARDHERIVEDIMLDLILGDVEPDNFEEDAGWRGFRLDTLKRRFAESLKGKTFPKAWYDAKRVTMRVVREKDGELGWEEVKK